MRQFPTRIFRVHWGQGSLLDLLKQLGHPQHAHAHLDPDLIASHYRRAPGWKGLFGQAHAAAGHLTKNAVGPGDIFLFWGLFQKTQERHGVLRFTGRRFHAIFGYLEIERVLDAGRGQTVPFAPEFPHFRPHYQGKTCRVYVARDQLSGTDLPGFGTLRYKPGLRLSTPDGNRVTDWQLPAFFHPERGASLTYHRSAWWWGAPAVGRTALRAVSRGQEFVATPHPEICAWARDLIVSTPRWGDAP
jgi:Nucleotide modification associated domain 3